jgi:hypothetical protein
MAPVISWFESMTQLPSEWMTASFVEAELFHRRLFIGSERFYPIH